MYKGLGILSALATNTGLRFSAKSEVYHARCVLIRSVPKMDTWRGCDDLSLDRPDPSGTEDRPQDDLSLDRPDP